MIWPLCFSTIEVNAEARQGREDVGEKDHPIGGKKPERFASTDLVGEIAVFRALRGNAGVGVQSQLAIHLLI